LPFLSEDIPDLAWCFQAGTKDLAIEVVPRATKGILMRKIGLLVVGIADLLAIALSGKVIPNFLRKTSQVIE